ncbi:hypothetical protein, partial [Serratia marcescens]|uniref:hypothetical protein n=1 Tax=Serratia marcescens TaxID=615 RepID=UPI00281362F5
TLKQIEKLSISNENEEDDLFELNNTQEFQQAGNSSVEAANTVNDRAETGTSGSSGAGATDVVSRTESELGSNLKWKKDHPAELVIGSPSAPVRTRNQQMNFEFGNSAFISQIEPKKVHEALADPEWILAMQE